MSGAAARTGKLEKREKAGIYKMEGKSGHLEKRTTRYVWRVRK